MQIFVKRLNADESVDDVNVITIEVVLTDTVGNLKHKIFDKENIAIAQQRLMYGGRELLLNGKSLRDYNIVQNATIHLLKIIDPTANFQIFVSAQAGQTITVDISPDDTVDLLKKEVEKKLSIKPEAQRLIFAGKQFQDGKLLKQYNIQRGCTVQLVLRMIGG